MRICVYRYQLFAEKINNNIGEYTAFGIAVLKDDDENTEEILRVSDISTDKALVEDFVGLCNRHQPAPCHIYDIIEDVLYS